jgi:hypothetical protein
MTRAQRIATSIAWQLGLGCLFVVLIFAIHDTAQSARAADAASGKRLAQARCSLCHIVEPDQREELANSPPFETIARRSGFDGRHAGLFDPQSASAHEHDSEQNRIRRHRGVYRYAAAMRPIVA